MVRVLVQIDLQNLFLTSKQKLDLEKLNDILTNSTDQVIVDKIVYMLRNNKLDSEKFEKKLLNLGYTVKVKDTRNNPINSMNHDIGITVDSIKRMDSFDKLILMSGDGDFVDLVKYLQDNLKQVDLWCFEQSLSRNLKPLVNKIHYITKEMIYVPPKVKACGF